MKPTSLHARTPRNWRMPHVLLPIAASLLSLSAAQAQQGPDVSPTAVSPTAVATTAVATVELPDAPTPSFAYDAAAYDQQTTSSSQPQATSQDPATSQATPQATAPRTMSEEQVKKQEKQRVLGVMPNFNVAYDSNVPPLTPSQKIRIAFHSSTDPYAFVIAGILSLYGQATDDHGPDYDVSVTNSAGQRVKVREEGYGMGWEGYGKRFGANYADSFDGNIIGNAFLPILLKEDPRYFRVGSGPIRHRFLFAIESTVWCRRDSGTWGPNYANVLGNIAAGGISNIYYPSYERGAGLTFERGLVVTAEGTVGALLNEFLPDLTRRYLHRNVSGSKLDANTPAVTSSPAPAPPSPAPDSSAPPQP